MCLTPVKRHTKDWEIREQCHGRVRVASANGEAGLARTSVGHSVDRETESGWRDRDTDLPVCHPLAVAGEGVVGCRAC